MSFGWLFCYASDPYMKDGKCMVDIKARKWFVCVSALLRRIAAWLKS